MERSPRGFLCSTHRMLALENSGHLSLFGLMDCLNGYYDDYLRSV